MNLQGASLVMIPEEELTAIKSTQLEILRCINEMQAAKGIITVKHITAKEFMAAVRICRSKFDQLVKTNKVKVIRKQRKIYLSASEIDRYFSDGSKP